jgi:hypothetical protein
MMVLALLARCYKRPMLGKSVVIAAFAAALGFSPGPACASPSSVVRPVLVAADEPHLPDAVPRVGAIRRGADGKIELVDPTAQSGTAGSPCAAKTICVGPGQAYSTLTAALAAARDNDTIEIVGGIYRESVRIGVNKLTIRGVKGQPHFDCAELHLVADKACLLLAANGITLENLEISGAVLPESTGANGACVRNEPNISFTLRRIVCHGSQDGLLSDGGNILIENSEFYDNGWTELTHNIYLGGNCRVTVRGSVFRDARLGHEFKSRCAEATIADSTFRSTKGSRNIDISDGGEIKIYRSTFEKTRGADSYEIIGFAPESCAHPGDMLLKDIVIINSQPEAAIHNYDKCAGHPIIIDGMTIKGIPPKEYGFIKATAGLSDRPAPANTGSEVPRP